MTEHWFPVVLIVELTGNSRQAVIKRLTRNDIPNRNRAKGKGLEYCVTDLPQDWQAIICEKLSIYIESSALVAEAGVVAEELYTAPVSLSVEADHIADAETMVGSAHPTLPESYERAVPASDVRAASIEVAAVPVEVVPDSREPHSALQVLETARHRPDPGLTKDESREAARALVLSLVDPWCWKHRIDQRGDCEMTFCKAYKAGQIAIPGWVTALVPTVSRTTLYNWRKLRGQPAKDGRPITALAGNFAKKKGGYIRQTPEVEKVLLSVLEELTIVSCQPKTVHRRMQKVCPSELVPSYPQVLRYLQWFKAERWAQYLALVSPKDFRNKVQMAVGRLDQDCKPNDRWQLDFTRNDVLLRIGETVNRFALGMCIDLATRRRKLILSPVPEGEATGLLLMQCIEDWGLPVELRPDNGKEFVNARVNAICDTLGIIFNPCTPGSPQEKGNVEKALGDLVRRMRTEPSFVGHNVSQRQQIREAKGEQYLIDAAPTFEEFRGWLDEQLDEIHATPHGGEGMDGMSPNQRLEWFEAKGWRRKECSLDQAALRRLVYSVEATARRDGVIWKGTGRKYITERLGEVSAGDKLRLTMDGRDLRLAHVYSLDMTKFLGVAPWEKTLTKNDLIAYAAASKAVQKGEMAGTKAGAKEGKKIRKEWEKDPTLALAPNAQAAAAQRITAAVQQAMGEELTAAGGDKVVELKPATKKYWDAATATQPPEDWQRAWLCNDNYPLLRWFVQYGHRDEATVVLLGVFNSLHPGEWAAEAKYCDLLGLPALPEPGQTQARLVEMGMPAEKATQIQYKLRDYYNTRSWGGLGREKPDWMVEQEQQARLRFA